MKEKIKILLTGLYLALVSEEGGSTEHLCECADYSEIADILKELGENELLEKLEKYRETDDVNLVNELSGIAYPNGRWGKRW